MSRRLLMRAALNAIAASLLLAPAVQADTCCANVPVRIDPPAVQPGDTVRLSGMRCLRSDGTGPLSLNLGAFWLATGRRPAEDPGDVPGSLPNPDLPRIKKWFRFQSAPPFDTTKRGEATIVVPDLPDGLYQLWWWCDNGGGPGAGIHYSTGQMLAIGVAPDTATGTSSVPVAADASDVPGWFYLAVGALAFVAMLWSRVPGTLGRGQHRRGSRWPHGPARAPDRLA